MIPAVEERLQKVLARAGFASRRGAEGLMEQGRVTVNGAVVREPGTKADPDRDDIRVDGVRVKAAKEPVYIVLNKPRGVVTTRRDPSGRPTVMDLVPGVSGLFPVGRLDLTTEGLILLTNDGAFAERVSHPRYEVPRVYHAKVRGVPDARALARLRRGVRVGDDLLAVDQVRLVEVDRNAWVEVTLHEGKQHEVKRLLEAVGHPVSKLRRVAFGPATLRGLPPGQFRALEPAEIAGLLRGEGSSKVLARPSRRRPRSSLARKAGRSGAKQPRASERETGGGKTARRGRVGRQREDGAGRGKGRRSAPERKTGARPPAASSKGARTAGTGESARGRTGARKPGPRATGPGKTSTGRTSARRPSSSGRRTGAAAKRGAGTGKAARGSRRRR
jgi:pseudouridine synthase